jgi:hypothetical protein
MNYDARSTTHQFISSDYRLRNIGPVMKLIFNNNNNNNNNNNTNLPACLYSVKKECPSAY